MSHPANDIFYETMRELNAEKQGKMICVMCKDDLTVGEIETHFKKPYFAKQECYQCSVKAVEKVKARQALIKKIHNS